MKLSHYFGNCHLNKVLKTSACPTFSLVVILLATILIISFFAPCEIRKENYPSRKITVDDVIPSLYFRIPSSIGPRFSYFKCAKTIGDFLFDTNYQIEKTETTLWITRDNWYYGFEITGENQIQFMDDGKIGTYFTNSQLQLQYD